jgi:sporulation protein YlmC with PRC-barrel domain
MRKDKHNTVTDSRLIRLEELKGFKVAEGDQDIRGWAVKTPDGKKIGKVEELIVDPAERRVRYMEIKADGKTLGFDHDQHILVPIGAARLQDKGDDVLLERLPAQGLAGVPPYQRGSPITRDYETSLRNYYGAAAVDSSSDYYRDDLYSESGFKRRSATGTTSDEHSWLPKLGDNEVTVPLVADQEVVVRRAGSNEEIVIRKTKGTDEARN